MNGAISDVQFNLGFYYRFRGMNWETLGEKLNWTLSFEQYKEDETMSLTNTQMTEIEDILKQSLRHKFMHYNPEPAVMPFHTACWEKTEWHCSHLFIL